VPGSAAGLSLLPVVFIDFDSPFMMMKFNHLSSISSLLLFSFLKSGHDERSFQAHKAFAKWPASLLTACIAQSATPAVLVFHEPVCG